MSGMQILAVPTASFTDVKKSPGSVFNLAAETNNAVYVFNRGSVSGVILTKDQYESLQARIDELEELLLDAEVARRLSATDVSIYSDASVRGKVSQLSCDLDKNDGWE